MIAVQGQRMTSQMTSTHVRGTMLLLKSCSSLDRLSWEFCPIFCMSRRCVIRKARSIVIAKILFWEWEIWESEKFEGLDDSMIPSIAATDGTGEANGRKVGISYRTLSITCTARNVACCTHIPVRYCLHWSDLSRINGDIQMSIRTCEAIEDVNAVYRGGTTVHVSWMIYSSIEKVMHTSEQTIWPPFTLTHPQVVYNPQFPDRV